MSTIVPVYYQIKQTIKGWITSGEFNCGEKIPSEMELAANFEVSRLTVRQAISQLVQEGLLTSKRGEGTFVTKNRSLIETFDLEFTGFLDDLFYQVSKVVTKSAEISRVVPSKIIVEKLDLDDPQEKVICIKRVRFLSGRSFAYTVNYFPVEVGERIELEALYKKPLLKILEQDLGYKFTEAFQTIEASFANHKVAKKLGVALGSPILFAERVMYVKKRKPIELVRTSYRGDLYKYIVRLKNLRKRGETRWVHESGLKD